MKRYLALFLTLFISTSTAIAAVGDVDNLSVKDTGDKEVTLEWSAVPGATGYVVLYGNKPVLSNESYNMPPVMAGNVTLYTVKNLQNGVDYYFSVVGLDAEGNNSPHYSNEVTASPDGPLDAGLVGVEAINTSTVKAVFSSSLPADVDLSNQINITKSFDNTILPITKAEFSDGGKSIVVTTGNQEPGTEYKFKYKTFESTFLGSLVSSKVSATLKINTVNVGRVGENDTIEVVFSEEINLGENPSSEIAIVETQNPDAALEIKDAIKNQLPGEGAKVLIRTAPQKPVSYTMLVTGVTNKAGESLSEVNSTYAFTGYGGTPATPGADKIPPEEVSNLRASITDVAKAIAGITWGGSLNSAKDLANYIVYLSMDNGKTFQSLATLDPTKLNYDFTGAVGESIYTFKVTAKDTAGNESKGKTFKLPGTGPAGLLLLTVSSLFGAGVIRRKR